MATERWVIDAPEEDVRNTALDLTVAPLFVTSASTPTPGLDPRWAQPSDADGDRLVAARYLNREVVIALQVAPSGSTRTQDAQAALGALAEKVAKVNREGGTLRRTLPSGDVITFDLLTASGLDAAWDVDWDTASVLRLELRFTAKPFARGPEQARSVHTETALPVLVFTETSIPGDAPALGRLVLSEASGSDQRWVVWGAQSRTYDPAASAALFYEAESCTALGSALVTTLAGASGGASLNVVSQGDLATDWSGVLSLQAAAGTGAYPTHVGDYRVFARIQRPATNTGTVSLALEWSTGDLRTFTRNAPVFYAPNVLANAFTIADLGVVSLPPATIPPAQWDGRIVARSTVSGDDVAIDCVWLVPTERAGEIAAQQTLGAPGAFLARDSFDQTAGTLGGKALPVGGSWFTYNEPDDFVVDATTHRLQRTRASADGTHLQRVAVANGVNAGSVVVQVDFNVPAWEFQRINVIARWVDADHMLFGQLLSATPPAYLRVRRTTLVDWDMVNLPLDDTGVVMKALPVTLNVWHTLRMQVDRDGSYAVWLWQVEQEPGPPVASGWDAGLATGGGWASGAVGFGEWTSMTSSPRLYDNFLAWTPPSDAAVFAGRKLELRHDGALRQDVSGTLWSAPSQSEGDLLTIPPSGAEGRPVRCIVKTSRSTPGTAPDAGVDDLSGQLYVTPRWLVVPS